MKNSWWLAAFVVVGVLTGAGILLLVTRPPRGKPIELLPLPTDAPITVFVSGSVKLAGLYTLPPGSRVNDAIQAAGGFSSEADTRAVNLADLLEDGEQVDVPSARPASEAGVSSGSASRIGQLVDINSATLDELDALPGIGPVTAQKIIDFRVVYGPFKAADGLLEVDGIGQVTFENIKSLITVGTSP
jgi:competence protein ComEA